MTNIHLLGAKEWIKRFFCRHSWKYSGMFNYKRECNKCGTTQTLHTGKSDAINHQVYKIIKS